MSSSNDIRATFLGYFARNGHRVVESSPLVPRNVPWFTVRAQDFPNPELATQILALDGVGGAEHYDGDYTEYHDWRERGFTSIEP